MFASDGGNRRIGCSNTCFRGFVAPVHARSQVNIYVCIFLYLQTSTLNSSRTKIYVCFFPPWKTKMHVFFLLLKKQRKRIQFLFLTPLSIFSRSTDLVLSSLSSQSLDILGVSSVADVVRMWTALKNPAKRWRFACPYIHSFLFSYSVKQSIC